MVMNHRVFAFLAFGLLPLAVYSQQAIPLVSQCEAGTSPVFLLQHNSTAGIRLRQVPTQNFIDCAEICSNNNNFNFDLDATTKAPSEARKNSDHYTNLLMRVLGLPERLARDCELLRDFDKQLAKDLKDCVGVEYTDGACHLIGSPPSTVPKNERYEQVDSKAPLATKSCVKSERICASPFHFDVHEQMILVGFAREVVPADSIQVCLSACLNAFDTFGFECESVMYYPLDAECILNTEDRLDRPDLFVEEHEDTVVYLDNNCAGSQCYAPYVTQYVAVEGRQLQAELDHSFPNIDLESCEQLCSQRVTITKNDFNCKSFMYNNKTRTCILSDERSTPLGRGNLTEAEGFNYYEKKCFASPRTCRNVASFTRVPQMLLVGFAAFVMENVPSVTMCLDQCTNPPPETGDKFVCKSAMYYYNEQECILNAESRATKPDLFIVEEEDFVVDYFDINCHLAAETCGNGRQVQTIRSLNAGLPEGDSSLHVIETVTGGIEECAKKCDAMAPEKCRSFNYDKEGKICNLLYLDGKTTLRPQVKNGIDLYDMHCLAAPPASCQTKGDATFSRHLYTKQPGLPTKEQSVVSLTDCLELCLGAEQCEGVNYNRRSGTCAIFAKIENNHGIVGTPHDHIDFYTNLCLVKEVDSASLSGAANVPKEVEVTTPTPKKGDSDGRLGALNNGQPTKKPVFREQEVNRRAPNTSDQKEPAVTGEFDVKKTQKVAPAGPPVLIPPSAVRTICNYEGMQVQIKNDLPFSGVVFVKNKYDTCRIEVATASQSATLHMGLPSNFGMKPIVLNANATPEEKIAELKATESREQAGEEVSTNEIRKRRQVASERDCGLADMGNGTYRTTVVVQTNNLGIPGLVTSMDQIYEVACDYSSMLGGKISTAANMTVHGPTPSVIQPKGKIELGNPVLMQMMAKGGGQKPVIQAKLGDILELRWEIMAMDNELDFFVKSCTAEPGTPSNREDEQLQLIEDGCPTPAVAQKLIPEPIRIESSAVKIAHLQAFRFDSSASVRVTCRLELCKGTCKPVTCNLIGGAQESWGRKKRAVPARNETDNDVSEFVTKRYKVPRFAQATTSVVIIDPLQQVNEPQAQVSMQKQSPIELNNAEPVVIEREIVTPEGQMCMNKWGLLAILGALLTIILVQAIVVGKYIFQRMLQMRTETATLKQYY